MNPRRKGHDGERELAALLREALGIEIARNLQQSRSEGHDLAVCGFALEVERSAIVTPAKVRQWWRQALAQAEQAKIDSALAYRQDRQAWTVRVPLSVIRSDLPTDLVADIPLGGFVALVRSGGPSGA